MKLTIVGILFLLIVLVSTAALRCGRRPLAPRIVSGNNAVPHSWPWQAELLSVDAKGRLSHSCGGTLVHPRFVVTAAHCIDCSSSGSTMVRLGEHNLKTNEPSQQDFVVARILKHPKYSSNTIDYDVAVLELDRPAVLNDKVNLACLSPQGIDVSLDSTCYITGWGDLYGGGPTPDILQEAVLPVVSNPECSLQNSKFGVNVTNNMVCAGYGGNSTVSGCHGDSGGPFVCRDKSDGRWYLQGAVSWGSPRCDAGPTFTVFARISRLRHFIDSAMSSETINLWTHEPTNPPCETLPITVGPQKPTNLKSGSCNFDEAPCNFLQDTNDQFDFTVNRGRTPSPHTGPSGDHTSGSGNYIYAKASNQQTGDRARITKHLILDKPACFSFYFHMYGDGIGYLKVYVNTQLVWQLHGNQGNQWIKGSFPLIPKIDNNFIWIDIEAVTGDSHSSDIALDDFGYQTYQLLDRGVCDVTPSNADPFNNPSPPPPLPNSCCGRSSFWPISRVIGGSDARPGSWPWQVGIKINGLFYCGGSLIAPRWVLTAAHCIFPGKTHEITIADIVRNVTEGTEQRFKTAKIIVHPKWNRTAIDSDIALIYLSRPVTTNERVGTVCLPKQDEVVPVGSRCYITGWGKIRFPGTPHHVLQQTVLPVASREHCRKKMSNSHGIHPHMQINENMICAGKEGSVRSVCHGDSGGPYVCKTSLFGPWVVQGVVSWTSKTCDASDLFSVFARVARFRDWIDYHVRSVG